MVEESIFTFLRKDKTFEQVYDECNSLEISLINEKYQAAFRTGRVISEILIKKLARNNKKTAKLFKKVNGKERQVKLSTLLNECERNHVIKNNILRKYKEIKEYGDPNSHGELKKYSEYDSKKIHKLIFDITLDCYCEFNIEPLINYKYNINELRNKFTVEEKEKHIQNIHESEINADEFIENLKNKDIFLTKDSFNDIIAPFESKLNNINKYHEDLNSTEIITNENLPEILDNFEESVKGDIIKSINETSKEQISGIYSAINELKDNQISIDEINDKIEEASNKNQKEIYKLMKNLAGDLIQNYISNILNELNSIPVIENENNEKIVIDAPNYEIIEDEYGYSIKELKNNFELNEDQEEAVTYNGEKPLIIDAGPGSGKTRVIIERVVYLIKVLKKDPSSILVITFTNKATDELRERFKNDTNLSMSTINQMRISTIHSFCRHIISVYEDLPYNFLKRNGERNLFLQKHRETLGFAGEAFFYNYQMYQARKKYEEYYSFCVNTPELVEFIKEHYPVRPEFINYINIFYEDNEEWMLPSEKEIESLEMKSDLDNARFLQIAESYPKFIELLEKEKAADSNFLLYKANELLKNESILKDIPFTNILIDEFQDTDPNQNEIFEKLLKIRDTFTIVGDIDQSIYGFRAAYPKYFNDYANSSEFKKVTLHYNYRSTKDIVDFNETFIKNERKIKKDLKPIQESRIPVFNLINENKDEQIENIIAIIKNLKENNKIKQYSDIALLFRTNYEAAKFIQPFEDANIPYYVKGINDLFEQNETKAIITLFWYLMPYNPLKLRNYEAYWLNFYAFTDLKYNSSKIFKLSNETQEILAKIQSQYQKDVLNEAKKAYYKKYKKNTRVRSYSGVFNLDEDVISDAFKHINTVDISQLDEKGFNKLGITNKKDINFFLELNKLKSIIYDENISYYDKPTTLELFYKMINISGYHDDILQQRGNHEFKKVRLNLALISEIISDYENIMKKRDYAGLYDYIQAILRKYSCPINELEDNTHKVHIMTIHKSKGLEYPVIILGSLEEGRTPREFTIRNEKYHTPNRFLKYKPDDIDEEKKQYEDEELRTIYVATTRAEELLILSTVKSKTQLIPTFLSNIKRRYKNIINLDISKFNSIPTLDSPKDKSIKKVTQNIRFEDITRDYLFCPLRYDLYNNTRYRNPLNNDKFTEIRMNQILNRIHNPNKKITKESIDIAVYHMINTYNISSNVKYSKTFRILNNISTYWEEYGKYYNILKNNVHVTLRMGHCDLNGVIDLIIKENDDKISIIKFIGSNDKIDNINNFMNILTFYAYVLSEYDDYKNYKIKNIILHSLEENKRYINEYNENNNKELLKTLDNITLNIVNDKFLKNNEKCLECEYNDFTCFN